MAAERPEIRVGGRVYTYSRHYRDKHPSEREASDEQIRYALLNPYRQRNDGPRRTVYWRYLPEWGHYLKVVEDRLPTGERQILTAHPDKAKIAEWGES